MRARLKASQLSFPLILSICKYYHAPALIDHYTMHVKIVEVLIFCRTEARMQSGRRLEYRTKVTHTEAL